MSSSAKTWKIKEAKFSCSAHATEDLEKVKRAMLHLLPEKLRNDLNINDQKIVGHSGNPIHLLNFTIKERGKLRALLDYLSAKMKDLDKELLNESIERRIGEDNSLYLRFNKQAAFQEVVSLDNGDNSIRVVIKFVIYKNAPNLLKEIIASFGLLK